MTPEQFAALHALAFTTPPPWSTKAFEDLLTTPAVFAETDVSPTGDLVGFALGRGILDEVELLTLAVHPLHRNRGIGRTLLSRFEETGSTRGGTRFFLEVAADNAAALGLYQRAGWQISGQRSLYYRSQSGRIDAILMEKLRASEKTP